MRTFPSVCASLLGVHCLYPSLVLSPNSSSSPREWISPQQLLFQAQKSRLCRATGKAHSSARGLLGAERSCRDEAYIKLFWRKNRKIGIPSEGGGCGAALPRADLAHQGVQSGAESLSRLKSAASISAVILGYTSWVPLFPVKEHFGCNSRSRLCVQLFFAFCWCNWWCQVLVCIFASLGRARHIQLSKYHILVGREEKATFSLGFVETVVSHLSPPF